MFKYILQTVEGIQWFGIASLLLFFITFCVAFFRAFFLGNKKQLDHMARLPLED